MHCSTKLARVCHKNESTKNFGHAGIMEHLEIEGALSLQFCCIFVKTAQIFD